MTSPKESHGDADKNGVCDTCLYVICAHTYAEAYEQTSELHWLENTCDCVVTLSKQPHAERDRDGLCDVCAYVLCTHTQSKESYDSNGQYHWHSLTCGCVTPPDNKELHEDMDKDGACDVCKKVSLDGKKIIFIGNSHIYYGCTVLGGDQNKFTRKGDDTGYFYQLCKANGENVSVTNFTFGGHGNKEYSTSTCSGGDSGTSAACCGIDHFSYLTDKYYDYVVMQTDRSTYGNTEFEDVFKDILYMMEIFREANPNVKFVLHVTGGTHNVSVRPTFPVDILNQLDKMEDLGVTIVDWGALVKDIINGDVQVPGATLEYNKNTFIVNQSASDGFHPNQLSGYITTLMTYAAITGSTAVGQAYKFVGADGYSTNGYYRTFREYIDKYYKNGATTNYEKVFASPSDVLGIQTLIDQYLAKKKFRDYDFEPLVTASTLALPNAILPTDTEEKKTKV